MGRGSNMKGTRERTREPKSNVMSRGPARDRGQERKDRPPRFCNSRSEKLQRRDKKGWGCGDLSQLEGGRESRMVREREERDRQVLNKKDRGVFVRRAPDRPGERETEGSVSYACVRKEWKRQSAKSGGEVEGGKRMQGTNGCGKGVSRPEQDSSNKRGEKEKRRKKARPGYKRKLRRVGARGKSGASLGGAALVV